MTIQEKIAGEPLAVPKKSKATSIDAITPPQMAILHLAIQGIAPLMVCRFSEKAMNTMREKHEAGSVAKSKKVREARDFDADFQAARHLSREGWDGVNASAFRNAVIDVCRVANFKMTHAKLALFVEADGFDKVDGVPLVKIESEADPVACTMAVRNATGVMDLRVRPRWDVWMMKPRIRFDMNVLTAQDVMNLMTRVGHQAGIGEGRPNSRAGAGMQFGLFSIIGANVETLPFAPIPVFSETETT